MGIDAVFIAEFDHRLSETELNLVKYLTHDRLPGFIEQISQDEEEYLIESKRPNCCVRFNNMNRYYGEGYERGPILEWLALADLLEFHFPNVIVHWGGDSGSAYMREWEKEERAELYQHFLKEGHIPYRSDGDVCPQCGLKSYACGWKKEQGKWLKCPVHGEWFDSNIKTWEDFCNEKSTNKGPSHDTER